MHKYLPLLLIGCACACTTNRYLPVGYSGKPYLQHIQVIPGRVECELYDTGGESIAYHDTDSTNNGSGKLNPANGEYLNGFRMGEGVDISYTKTKGIDDNPYNQVAPVLKQLYVGWTKPGEWINYTVKVTAAGNYHVGVMYTCNGGGAISFDVDGKPATQPLAIPSTHNDKDTVAWRQWHHWNRIDSLTSISLTKGLHLLTLHIVANGNMNLDWLEWKKE